MLVRDQKYGIEYDTDWVKNHCIICGWVFRNEEEGQALARYESRGNFCTECSALAKTKREASVMSFKKAKQWSEKE